jgi:lipid II:glycine glycyltransferase (peptidoglycan interpeptide bridge formation enzyme)
VIESVQKLSSGLPEASASQGSAHFHQQDALWRESTKSPDTEWDDFLASVPLGHFQQSSQWAQAKSTAGWRSIRSILRLGGQIAGGFQILARDTRFGRIGYISKGPVVAVEAPQAIEEMILAVKRIASTERLSALIIQAPDESRIESSVLSNHGFLPNHLVDVVGATLLVDLSVGMEQIGRCMRKNTWVEIRQAQRRGVTIREGTEQDIPDFFRLMLATCQRQNTRPSPSRAEDLLEVWKTFALKGRARLSIAECGGAAVAGAFCICFGSRVTIWKKGWSGAHRERHPNQLLLFESIEWAEKHGYKLYDFAALAPDTAHTLLQGRSLSEKQKKSRDFVHLSYGNKPVLLPEDRIYVSNPFLRRAYQMAVAVPSLRRLAGRLAHV